MARGVLRRPGAAASWQMSASRAARIRARLGHAHSKPDGCSHSVRDRVRRSGQHAAGPGSWSWFPAARQCRRQRCHRRRPPPSLAGSASRSASGCHADGDELVDVCLQPAGTGPTFGDVAGVQTMGDGARQWVRPALPHLLATPLDALESHTPRRRRDGRRTRAPHRRSVHHRSTRHQGAAGEITHFDPPTNETGSRLSALRRVGISSMTARREIPGSSVKSRGSVP